VVREVDLARLKGEESLVRLVGDCNPWVSQMLNHGVGDSEVCLPHPNPHCHLSLQLEVESYNTKGHFQDIMSHTLCWYPSSLKETSVQLDCFTYLPIVTGRQSGVWIACDSCT
jgi:hypothetical protein